MNPIEELVQMACCFGLDEKAVDGRCELMSGEVSSVGCLMWASQQLAKCTASEQLKRIGKNNKSKCKGKS